MGLLDLLRRLLGGGIRGAQDGLLGVGVRRQVGSAPPKPGRLDLGELVRRLGMPLEQLRAVPIRYQEFTIAKRSGGCRTIHAPCPELKALQRRILRRLLRRLRSHPAATGFEPGKSIVTNSLPHVGAALVLRMDIEGFFPSTSADRVREFLARIGWSGEAAGMLTELCTHKGALPQGAPTSPRLSNLVNWAMDARLAGLARRLGAAYTRYADDITFSFRTDDHAALSAAIGSTKRIVGEFGYRLHHKRKLTVRRRHEAQVVTGLVVNRRAALPRRIRRRLRAVEHRIDSGRPASMSPQQLAGWYALIHMVETQGRCSAADGQ